MTPGSRPVLVAMSGSLSFYRMGDWTLVLSDRFQHPVAKEPT